MGLAPSLPRLQRTHRIGLAGMRQRTRARLHLVGRLQIQLLADFAYRRHYLGRKQLQVVFPVPASDRSVVLPQNEDSRPQRFHHHAQFGDNGFGRAADNAEGIQYIGELIEDGLARSLDVDFGFLPEPRTMVDLGRGHIGPRWALRGRCLEWGAGALLVGIGKLGRDTPGCQLGVVSRWKIVGRLREQAVAAARTPEHVELGNLPSLLFALRDVNLLHVAEVLRADLVAEFSRAITIDIPQFNGRLQEGGQRDVGVAFLSAPQRGLGAQEAGNPHLRMRLLHRYRPRIDETVMEMAAFVAPWTGLGPRSDDEVVRLVEVFAVIGRIGVVRELLAARAADPSRDQPPARNHIDHRQLFRQPQRIAQRQRIAYQ